MLSLFAWFPFSADCFSFPVFSPCWKEAARTASIAERQTMPLEDAVLCLLWNVGTLHSLVAQPHTMPSCPPVTCATLGVCMQIYMCTTFLSLSGFPSEDCLLFSLFFLYLTLPSPFYSWRYIAHTYLPQSSLQLLHPFNLHSCYSRQLWG